MDNQEQISQQTTDYSQKAVVRSPSALPLISMAVFVLLSLSAVAFLYYQNQQLKTMLASYQPTTTPVSSSPSPSPDPTADWKTFNNGYVRFKYPNNWTYQKDSVFSPNTPNDYNVIVYRNDIDLNKVFSKDCYTLEKTTMFNLFLYKYKPIPTTPETEFGTCRAIDPSSVILYASPIENKKSRVRILYPIENAEAEKVSSQILSTFKFTDPKSTKEGEVILSENPNLIVLNAPTGSIVTNKDGINYISYNGSTFIVPEDTRGSMEGPCSPEEFDKKICGYTDEIGIKNINFLRIWKRNGETIMLNPQEINIDGQYMNSFTISKTIPTNVLTNNEVSIWKQLLQNISLLVK